MAPLLVVTNATGVQGASVVRAASKAGFQVRAQVRSSTKSESKALAALPGVSLAEGSLDDTNFVGTLFKDADLAYINTTYFQQNEAQVGKSLALAAKNAGVKHTVHSSLGDHLKATNGKWRVEVFAVKYEVEEYIRTLENFNATFVYVGAYMSNYNDVNFGVDMKRQPDGSIVWRSKYKKDLKIPYTDVERDLGPLVVKLFKDGPEKWNQKRVAAAFDCKTPAEIAEIFGEATGTKITYEQDMGELNPNEWLDTIIGVINAGVLYNFDCKVPEDARELNPNWHSLADFAKDSWKNPV